MDEIDSLSSFLPPIVVRRCNGHPEGLQEPFREGFQGALLFADISGFTSLAETLAEKGVAGAEELTRALNAYFGQLIRVIAEHGGEVAKFAGDALLALWPVEDEPLPVATLRAVGCGLAIQRELSSFQATHDIRLSLRIGVGAGELAVLGLGGVFGRWEVLFTGAPIAEMGAACTKGSPGEVMLAAPARARIADLCEGEEREGGHLRVTRLGREVAPRPLAAVRALAEVRETLRSFIPAAIRSWLVAGQSAWIGELRRVSILFVNLPDLTFDTPLALSQDVMRALQAATYRFEGSINKLSIDEKGVTLVAALGLPPLPHEDDAVRAVQAAFAIREALERLSLRCSIGVSRGRVFCGVVGSGLRREYTVMGDTVNLAARLMQAAHGGMLCDASTSQEAGERVDFAALPPVHMKGKSQDVPVFRPDRERRPGQRGDTREIVGRAAESRTFRSLVEQATNGASCALVLEGEAGVGKSRLLEEWRRCAVSLGVPCFQGGGDALAGEAPLLAWRPVLAALLGAAPLADATRDRLAAVLPDFDRVAPLLNDVLPSAFPETPESRELRGEGRASLLRDLLARVVAACAPRPFVVVLEDAHWMDASSWTLLRRVFHDVDRILIVVSTRPRQEAGHEELAVLLKEPGVHHVVLGNLTREEVHQLARSRLSVRDVPGTVLEAVWRHTEGNPFFAEESILSLRDSGTLRISGEACALAPGITEVSDLPLSDTIEGVISRRIDRLSPQQQLTLKVASVAGQSFEYGMLHDIYPIEADRPSLREHISDLSSSGMVREEGTHPDLTYIFRHVLIREVTYNLMLFAQRQTLHQAIADWYHSRVQTDPHAYGALLAHHRELAGQYDLASLALEGAAEGALRAGAFHEAAGLYLRLLALAERKLVVPTPERRAHWTHRLGLARYSVGDLAAARRDFLDVLSTMGVACPQAPGRVQLGLLKEFLRHAILVVPWPRRRRPPPTDVEERRLELVAGAHEMIGAISQFENDRSGSGYHCLRLHQVSRRMGPAGRPLQSVAQSIMALMMGSVIGPSSGDRYARRALDLLDGVTDRDKEAETRLLVGLYELGMGRLRRAADHLQASMDVSRQIGFLRAWEEGAFNRSLALLLSGEFESARELAEELRRSARGAQDLHSAAYADLALAFIALRQGDGAEALRRLDDQRKSGFALSDAVGSLASEALCVQASWLAADREAARRGVDALVSRIGATTPVALPSFLYLACAAELAMRMAEEEPTSSTRKQLAIVLRRLKQYGGYFPMGRPFLACVQGWAALRSGRRGKAERLFRRAEGLALDLGMPYEAEMARKLPVSSPRP